MRHFFNFVFRVVLAVVVLQVSGFGQRFGGSCCLADGDRCGEEVGGKPCTDCPPDCPKCHCNADRMPLPAFASEGDVPPPGVALAFIWAPGDLAKPPSAPVRGIFRPPMV